MNSFAVLLKNWREPGGYHAIGRRAEGWRKVQREVGSEKSARPVDLEDWIAGGKRKRWGMDGGVIYKRVRNTEEREKGTERER
jgi:hypothetical protein